jgi:serine/threonine protein kinase
MKSHSFSPKLYDIIIPSKFETNLLKMNCLFIVMQYSENDLREVITENIDEGENDSVLYTIIYNILCATKFIHSANIMHRDFKPDNFLMSNNCEI